MITFSQPVSHTFFVCHPLLNRTHRTKNSKMLIWIKWTKKENLWTTEALKWRLCGQIIICLCCVLNMRTSPPSTLSNIFQQTSFLTLTFSRIASETLRYQAPSWLLSQGLDRSQDGRWLLVCRVWTPTGHLVQKTQTTGWRKTRPGRGCGDLFPSSSFFCVSKPTFDFSFLLPRHF